MCTWSGVSYVGFTGSSTPEAEQCLQQQSFSFHAANLLPRAAVRKCLLKPVK